MGPVILNHVFQVAHYCGPIVNDCCCFLYLYLRRPRPGLRSLQHGGRPTHRKGPQVRAEGEKDDTEEPNRVWANFVKV